MLLAAAQSQRRIPVLALLFVASIIAATFAYAVAVWRCGYCFVPSMPGSPVRDFRMVPSLGLMVCTIEKNANTALSDLLCSLSRTGTMPHGLHELAASQLRTPEDFEYGCSWNSNNAASLSMSEAAVWRAFGHAMPVHRAAAHWPAQNWTSAVFVRDPLERFLSGYISKCTDGHDPDRHVCTATFGSRNASFEHAVSVMGTIALRGPDADLPSGAAEDHFRRQSSFCDGAVGRGEFDRYYVLRRETSRDDIRDLLHSVGVASPTEATPAFDYHFPPPGVTLHATYRAGSHTTQSASAAKRARFYGSGAEARALVRTLLRYFAPDYRNMPMLPLPEWAVDPAGEDLIRSLQLTADSRRLRPPHPN